MPNVAEFAPNQKGGSSIGVSDLPRGQGWGIEVEKCVVVDRHSHVRQDSSSPVALLPEALQGRVQKSYVRLELGEPTSHEAFRQFENDSYESDSP